MDTRTYTTAHSNVGAWRHWLGYPRGPLELLCTLVAFASVACNSAPGADCSGGAPGDDRTVIEWACDLEVKRSDVSGDCVVSGGGSDGLIVMGTGPGVCNVDIEFVGGPYYKGSIMLSSNSSSYCPSVASSLAFVVIQTPSCSGGADCCLANAGTGDRWTQYVDAGAIADAMPDH